jgi:ABC-2 type transport system permease protein
VADLAQPVGILKQIVLIAGLRWRLLHNSLRRKQNRLNLLGLIILSLFAAAFVIGLSFALFTGAYDFVSTGKESWLALFFWAIFFWWQLFPIVAAGFGASFEFRALLRFPVSLSAFYIIGLAYGLADFTGLAALCWIIAITFGAAAAKFALLVPMLLLAALFVLFNIALERLLGSWIERLLARRRTRELFFAGFILLMVSLQFLAPLLGRYANSAGPWISRALPYLAYFPASFVGKGAGAASAGNYFDFAIAGAGLAFYVLFFGALLWFRFAAQHSGEELGETAAPEKTARSTAARESPQDALSLLSPQVAAVVRKEVHYLLRNGFAAMLLFLPPILVFALISQYSLLHFMGSKGVSPELFFPGLMAYIVLILMAPAYNSFAYENAGVQTYFTAPLRFRVVLLGKNFVQVCLIVTELTLCIAAFCYRVGTPSAPIFFATLAGIVFTVIGQLSIANWSSLSFPRKLAFGQVHGQRQSKMAVLIAFGAQLLLFGISSLVLTLGRWTGDRWLPAEAFAVLAAAAVGGYVASLDSLTSYAEKKKENLIEALSRVSS